MLYEHQESGASWLADRARAYLGDRPGLGKTRTLGVALNFVDSCCPLIVCPAIVRTHWHRELCLVRGVKLGLVKNAQWQPRAIIKSYDEIVRGGMPLMAQLVLQEKVDALIVDEAHYCKHATSQRAQILFGKDGYARRIERVWPASGTPMPRNPSELATIILPMFPEVALAHGLRTISDWNDRFCVTEPRNVRGKWIEKVVGVQNADELKQILDAVMLARTLDDVGLDVPELDWQVTRLDVSGEARKEIIGTTDAWSDIERALTHSSTTLEEIAEDPHVARMRRRLGELKVAPVAEMLSSQLADSDEKVVVFAHHRSVLGPLKELLGTFGVAYIDGDVGGPARDAAIDRFQTDPRCRVFLGQNIACQTGITLTAARRCVLVEPDWTAVVNDQLGHRIARIGQKAEHCIGQMIALAGTLDEAIVAQNARETRMVAEVMR